MPYATGLVTPISTRIETQRSRTAFSAISTCPTSTKRPRAVSRPRTSPISPDPIVVSATSQANAPKPSKSSPFAAYAPKPVTTVLAPTTRPSRGRSARTPASDCCAATLRAIQCWTGKVSAAADSPQ